MYCFNTNKTEWDPYNLLANPYIYCLDQRNSHLYSIFFLHSARLVFFFICFISVHVVYSYSSFDTTTTGSAQNYYEVFWTNPGSDNSLIIWCTATYLKSLKQSKKTNMTCRTQLENQGWNYKSYSLMGPYTWTF